jgi:RNA polymerase sigma-70 factor, ECF subfamily
VEVSEQKNIHELLQDNIVMFEVAYKEHFKSLYIYAFTILNNEIQAEEIVQNIFLKIWEKKEKINIEISLKAYLFKSVYFDCLNLLKHQKVKSKYESHALYEMSKTKTESASQKIMYKNLEEKFREVLNELPEQCRTVFQLSRFEDLKYREIASKLNISEKTVEAHMSKALKTMRIKLAEFIATIIGLIVYIKNYLS